MAAEQEQTELRPRAWGPVIVAWIVVCAPLAWGVFMTLKKAAQLFDAGG